MIHFPLSARMCIVKAVLLTSGEGRQSMTDSEILQLIRESPSKGHRALFDEYYNYVCAISANVLRGTGTQEDIDECIVEVFTDVIMHLDPDRASGLKAYIGTSAKHRAISMRRSITAKSGRNIPMDSDDFPELPSGEDVAANAEKSAAAEELLREIDALGEPDSTIIIQKYFYDRKSKEIAAVTGLSPAMVRLRCSRALKKLRKALGDDT